MKKKCNFAPINHHNEMTLQTLTSYFTVFDEHELSAGDRELIEAARKASDTSYAPYSHFHVGAALRLSDGTVVVGSNQENASFGVTQCAERNALHHAACYHPTLAPTTLAIAARSGNTYLSQPIPPCGVCRQAIMETEDRYGKKIRILLYGEKGTWVCEGIENLLPLRFVGDTMS